MRYVTAFAILFLAVLALGIGTGYIGKTMVRESEAPAFVQKGLEKLKITTLKGAQGDRGHMGLPGDIGLPGKDGVDGLNGKDGLPGAKGDIGLTGKDGLDAVCFEGCCADWCMPVLRPAPVKAGLIFTQSFTTNAAPGSKVTISVNGTPVPATK